MPPTQHLNSSQFNNKRIGQLVPVDLIAVEDSRNDMIGKQTKPN